MSVTNATSGAITGSLQALMGAKVAKTSSDDLIKDMQAKWKEQMDAAATAPDTDTKTPNPSVYATVQVAGKTAATLFDDGSAVSGSDTYSQLKDLPSMDDSTTLVGPALAQKRADEIAQQLGGTVEKAATTPSTTAIVSQSMSDASAKTKSDTQIMGQSNDNADGSSSIAQFTSFMNAAKDGPAAFWRAQFLASQGLSEKDVAAMSPEHRAKLEDKIKSFIKQKVDEANATPNHPTDVTASATSTQDDTGQSGQSLTDRTTHDKNKDVGKDSLMDILGKNEDKDGKKPSILDAG